MFCAECYSELCLQNPVLHLNRIVKDPKHGYVLYNTKPLSKFTPVTYYCPFLPPNLTRFHPPLGGIQKREYVRNIPPVHQNPRW